MSESPMPNEPMLLQAMRAEEELTAQAALVYGDERAPAEAQRIMARVESEYRKVDTIAGLMMPEVLRMLLRDGLARKAATAGKAGA